MVWAYGCRTAEELAEYARFSESPLGGRLLKIYEESLREAVRIAEQRAVAALRGLTPPTARRGGERPKGGAALRARRAGARTGRRPGPGGRASPSPPGARRW